MSSAAEIRKRILRIIHQSRASHIGSSLSVVEILNAIYSIVDLKKILLQQNDRDRVILSKGHAAAALYAVLNHYGLMDDKTLDTYYQNNSVLGGHVSHSVNCVEHSTGALGHGLAVGVGMAVGLRSKKLNGRVFVVTGDGEMHEGSNWESLMLAGHLRLGNLCVLVDNNKLGGVGPTKNCCSLDSLSDKFKAFGIEGYNVDGHSEKEITDILHYTSKNDKPVGIVCHTVKGKGVSFMEHENVWHYRPPDKEAYDMAIKEIEKEN
ncbi:MAG: transketolase [Proteobacteria bacterium]|nr:transketolase [Pseudomonadota bacterium]MBU1389469.1 transketolase [Pseudomonadota bacterium]MBU1541289.1 transketolase [Pseudomonadota bacterium]